jgi:hypothetical protein
MPPLSRSPRIIPYQNSAITWPRSTQTAGDVSLFGDRRRQDAPHANRPGGRNVTRISITAASTFPANRDVRLEHLAASLQKLEDKEAESRSVKDSFLRGLGGKRGAEVDQATYLRERAVLKDELPFREEKRREAFGRREAEEKPRPSPSKRRSPVLLDAEHPWPGDVEVKGFARLEVRHGDDKRPSCELEDDGAALVRESRERALVLEEVDFDRETAVSDDNVFTCRERLPSRLRR